MGTKMVQSVYCDFTKPISDPGNTRQSVWFLSKTF
jgi:hypothetical protein